MRYRSLLALALAASAALLPMSAQADRDRDRGRDDDARERVGSAQLGPRPFFLVEDMTDSALKRELQSCSRRGSFRPAHCSFPSTRRKATRPPRAWGRASSSAT
jgi:hypothetical protein